jgi:predicted transcriptional regulator
MTKFRGDKQRILWLLELTESVGQRMRQRNIAKHLGITQQRASLLLREMQYKDRSVMRTQEDGYIRCAKK